MTKNQPDKTGLRKEKRVPHSSRHSSEKSQWLVLEAGGHTESIARKKRVVNACIWVSPLYLIRNLSPRNSTPTAVILIFITSQRHAEASFCLADNHSWPSQPQTSYRGLWDYMSRPAPGALVSGLGIYSCLFALMP